MDEGGAIFGSESRKASFTAFVLRSDPALDDGAFLRAVKTIQGRIPAPPPEVHVPIRTVICSGVRGLGVAREAAELVATGVRVETGTRPWVAIVTSDEACASEFAMKAGRWIDVAKQLVVPRVIAKEEAVVMTRLLAEPGWASQLASLLDPLAEHDHLRNTKALQTLDLLLLEVQSQGEVAQRLKLDRTTVTRHMATAATVLGRDIRWGVDRMMVEQALLARRAVLAVARSRGSKSGRDDQD